MESDELKTRKRTFHLNCTQTIPGKKLPVDDLRVDSDTEKLSTKVWHAFDWKGVGKKVAWLETFNCKFLIGKFMKINDHEKASVTFRVQRH
jgi:hypothetical protein